MAKWIKCPRCGDTEPGERAGPWFEPCKLCDGARTVSPTLASAYYLCIDLTKTLTGQWYEIRRLRNTIPE